MAFSYCNDRGAVAFVKKFHNDCKKLGDKANTLPEFILAVAASETTYGRLGRFAKYQNYFSMETRSDNPSIPYAIAYHIAGATANGKHPVKVAQFMNFYMSGLSFIEIFGHAIRNRSRPRDFVYALKDAGFNTGDAKTGGRPELCS